MNTGKIFQSASEQSKLIDEEEWEKRRSDWFNEAEGTLNLQDGYDCRDCKNKGWISNYFYCDCNYWTTALHPCACIPIRKSKREKKQSGLNASGRYTFDNYQTKDQWQEDIKASAMAFMADLERGAWFFIGGQSGAGKTHICTAIAETCIDLGRRAKYMVWSEEIKRIKGLIANEPEKYQAAMRELCSVPVLLIDDLFKGGRGEDGKFRPPTEADIKAAFEILNARYNNPQSITIISSERMLSEICDLDNAIGGRIAERAGIGDYIINLPSNPKLNYRVNKVVKY